MSVEHAPEALRWLSFAIGDVEAARSHRGHHVRPRIVAFEAQQADTVDRAMTSRKRLRAQHEPTDPADGTQFVLDDEHWQAFVDLLNRPAQPMDNLAAFLAAPSVLDAAADDADEPEAING